LDNKTPGFDDCTSIPELAIPYWREGANLYIVPINIDNTHWTLITVHMDQKCMAYHDSLGMYNGIDGMDYMGSVFYFLQEYQFIIDGNHENAPQKDDWTFYDATHFYSWDDDQKECLNAPQKNSYDCGIFLLKFAELCLEFDTFNIGEMIMENLPDRLVIRRAILGLYAKYLANKDSKISGVMVAPSPNSDSRSTVGNRNTKRANDEVYGSICDTSFKRVKTADRNRSDIILRTDGLPKPIPPPPSKKSSKDEEDDKQSLNQSENANVTDENEDSGHGSSGKCFQLQEHIILIDIPRLPCPIVDWTTYRNVRCC